MAAGLHNLKITGCLDIKFNKYNIKRGEKPRDHMQGNERQISEASTYA